MMFLRRLPLPLRRAIAGLAALFYLAGASSVPVAQASGFGGLLNSYRFGAPPASVTLAIFSATNSNSTSVSWPAGLSAGQLAVFIDIVWLYSSGSTTGPTGFTSLLDFAGTARIFISYKILTGTESGTIAGTPTATLRYNRCLYIFDTGATSYTVANGMTWNKESTTGNPVSQTVTSSAATVPAIVFGVAHADSSTATFSTNSPALTTQQTGSADAICGYKIYNSSPVNHSVDTNDNGTNLLVSGYITVTP